MENRQTLKAGIDARQQLPPEMTVNQAVIIDTGKQNAVPKWKPLTSEDFNGKPIEEILPIVDTLLYPGLAQLGSPPKFGKSYLALDLGYSVATGNPFMGKRVIRPGQVLYIDLEGKKQRTQKRLLNMGIHKVPDAMEILYRTQDSTVLTIDTGFLDQLKLWLDDHKAAVLIIVDMWREIKGRTVKNETEYDSSSRMMGLLQSLALQKNIAILILLHTRKGNTMRGEPDDVFEEFIGSTGQFATTDCAWAITGKRTDENKRFSVICRDNDSGQEDFVIKFENFRYHIVATREEAQRNQAKERYEKDPVVFTIKRLIDNGGSWHGTATDFNRTLLELTGECKEGKSFNAYVKKIEHSLLKYDGIRIVFPNKDGGNKGRIYKFYKPTPKQLQFEEVPPELEPDL